MANVWQGVLTKKGLALQSKLTAGSTLTITRIVSGAGKIPDADREDQTAVTDPKQQLSANPITINNNKQAEIPVLLANKGVTSGYTVHQIGFYAADPDEGEILYLIAQDDTGEIIPTETDSPNFSVSWTFIIGFGNASQITIYIDPKTYITYEMAMDLFAPKGHGLGEEQNLLSNKDLNDITKNGWYSLGSGCLNLPAAIGSYQPPSDSEPAFLRVESSGPIVYQYFYPRIQQIETENDAASMTGYYRQRVNGSWAAWRIVSGVTGKALSANPDISKLIQPGSFHAYISSTTALAKFPTGARAGRYCIVNNDTGSGRILQQVHMVDESGSQVEGDTYFRTLDDNKAVNPVWRPWTKLVTSSEFESYKANNFASKIIPERTSGTSATNRKITLDGITSYNQLYGVELTVSSAYLDFNGGLAVTFEVNSLGTVPVYFLDPYGSVGNLSVPFWATSITPYKITYLKISGTQSVFYVYATPYVMATQYRYGFVKITTSISDTTNGDLVPNVDAIRSSIQNAGGTVRQATAPTNTRMTWIDSSNNDIPKYYDGTAWVPFVAVWG